MENKTSIEEQNNISEETKMNNSNIIKNISFDQKEILWNIMKLYNEGNAFDCDMTASSLKFYEHKNADKYNIPEPKYLFDVYPQQEKIKKITQFKELPLKDGEIHSIVVDLPFVISPHTAPSAKNPKEGSNIIQNRFSSWYPYTEAYENFFWWMKECARVIDEGGIVVWKMQDTISGSVNHPFIEFSALCGQYFGLYLIDEFILEAKARLISPSKYKKQCHARKFTSEFLVLKKDTRLADKFSPLNMLEYCKQNVYEGKVIEVK